MRGRRILRCVLELKEKSNFRKGRENVKLINFSLFIFFACLCISALFFPFASERFSLSQANGSKDSRVVSEEKAAGDRKRASLLLQTFTGVKFSKNLNAVNTHRGRSLSLERNHGWGPKKREGWAGAESPSKRCHRCSVEVVFSFSTDRGSSTVCEHAKLPQSCPALCDPMDCSSSVHWILQARILVWVAVSTFPIKGSNSHLLCVLHW